MPCYCMWSKVAFRCQKCLNMRIKCAKIQPYFTPKSPSSGIRLCTSKLPHVMRPAAGALSSLEIDVCWLNSTPSVSVVGTGRKPDMPASLFALSTSSRFSFPINEHCIPSCCFSNREMVLLFQLFVIYSIFPHRPHFSVCIAFPCQPRPSAEIAS